MITIVAITICLTLLPEPSQRSDVSKPRKICSLPGELSESSGLIVINNNHFRSINDSGNDPSLFAFDSSGDMLVKNNLKRANNKDWEALANAGDTIFVGNIGNNRNNRKDLAIYVINKNGKVYDTIPFHYPDQKQFPPPMRNMNFDAEGMFYLEDHLYIFSKSRIPNGGYSKVYQLPLKAHKDTLQPKLLDSLKTSSMVTGATIRPDKSEVLLMSYGKIFKVAPFDPENLNKASIKSVKIPPSQTEAIDYLDAHTFYYTDEQGSMYKMATSAFND